MELPKLNRAIQAAQKDANLTAKLTGVSRAGAVHQPTSSEHLRSLPQLTAELDLISDIMLENPRITRVTLYDVGDWRPGARLGAPVKVMDRHDVLRGAGGSSGKGPIIRH